MTFRRWPLCPFKESDLFVIFDNISNNTMAEEDRASSYRFFVQMIINIFLCKKAQEIIAKRVMKEDKLSKKSYLIYVVFALTLFAVNQSVYMFFKNDNLY